MAFYQDFEDAVRLSLESMFPGVPVIYAYDNGPEEATPYILVQVIQLDQLGRENISGRAGLNSTLQVIKHYEGMVSIKFVGDETKHLVAGELASTFDFILDTPVVQETLWQNKLSLMRKSVIRRVPMRWDTRWYMAYQQDVFFAFSVSDQQAVDTIDTVVLTEYISW